MPTSSDIAALRQRAFDPYLREGYVPAEIEQTPGEKEKFKDGLTPQRAEELLRQDLKPAERAVKHYVEQPLTQNQYDAVVSLAFNSGAGGLRKSGVPDAINMGNYMQAAKNFLNIVKVTALKPGATGKNGSSDYMHIVSDGLTRRRRAEMMLFMKKD